MSDTLERVRGVRELPIFPLPLVLFPCVPQPLHIFEPRYRQLLADVRAGDNLFGLSYFDAEKETSDVPPAGHIGCAMEIAEVEMLPDGRSNVMTLGVVRYRVESYVERGEPYLRARIVFFEDEEEDAEPLESLAHEVAELFTRVAQAVQTINDGRGGTPELPESEPEILSFLIAAAMELDAEARQSMLELRSTSERLQRLHKLLTEAVKAYESRARTHNIAKTNGHAGKHLNLEE